MKNYKFCPYCGSPNRKYKEFFGCPKCRKKVFMDSVPCVSAFIIGNGKYLICKRAIEPSKGAYDVIGGFLKPGEHPETGIIREFKEETGLNIKVIDLLGVYMDKYEYQEDISNTLGFCYIEKIISGKAEPQDDAASLHWLPIDKVPKDIAFEWIKKALKDLQVWYRQQK